MKSYVYNLARIGGFIGLLFFGFFSFSGQVKADSVGYSNEQSNFNFNSGRWYDNVWSGQSFTASTTNITEFDFLWGSDYVGSAVMEVKICENPDLSNVQPCDGKTLVYSESFNVSPSSTNELIQLHFSEIVPLDIGTDYGIVLGNSEYDWYFSYRANLGGDTAFIQGQHIGSASDGINRDMWFKLYYDPAYFASNDYILYYGDNPYYQVIGASSALPVVYDVCDSWDSEHPFSLELRKSPYTSSDWISLDSYTLSSCSGTLLLNDISATTELSETAKLVIYNGETTIAESNEFLYVSYTPLSVDNNSFIHYYYPNGLYVDTSGGNGTTTINFAYDVCADSNFASSTFYLKNLDTGNTGVSFTPTQCNAVASLELPYTQDLQLFFPAFISYQRGGREYLKSKIFLLTFFSNNLVKDNGQLDLFFGKTARQWACSEQEWLDAENSSWLSSFPSMCNVKETFYSGLISVSDIVQSSVDWFISQLSDTFPLNIPTRILKSWDDSKTVALTSSFSIFDIANKNDEITTNLPSGWFGTSTEVVILGKSTMTGGNNPDALEMWAKIKAFTVFLQWALFALGFLAWAKSVYKDLSSETHNDENL